MWADLEFRRVLSRSPCAHLQSTLASRQRRPTELLVNRIIARRHIKLPLPPVFLDRNSAVELGRNKRRTAENAERRRELLFRTITKRRVVRALFHSAFLPQFLNRMCSVKTA